MILKLVFKILDLLRDFFRRNVINSHRYLFSEWVAHKRLLTNQELIFVTVDKTPKKVFVLVQKSQRIDTVGFYDFQQQNIWISNLLPNTFLLFRKK